MDIISNMSSVLLSTPLTIDLITPTYNSEQSQVNWTGNVTVVENLVNLSTRDYLDGFPYPSKYPWWHIILSSVVVTFIIIVIILGNTLVIVAIARDNNLKGLQNWFIASLAVSDLLLGILIMPFSLANELMGYWFFGTTLCQMWLSIDVLLCTASILNLCLISLDRYWSITRAVSYVRNRTKKRAVIMITTVWALSGIICFPPLVGWKRPQSTKFGFPLCLLSEEEGYVVYSTLGSFFIPLIVMVIVYFKIYIAARNRARRNLKKKQIVPPHGKQSTSTSSTVKDNHSPKFKGSFEKLKPISDSECAILGKGSGNESTAMSDSCNDTSKGIKMAVINHKGVRITNLDEKRKLLCEDTDLTESEAAATVTTTATQVESKQPWVGFTNVDISSDVEACNRQCNIKHNGYSPLKTADSTNDTSVGNVVSTNDHQAGDNCFQKDPIKNSEGECCGKIKDPIVPGLNIVQPSEVNCRQIKSPSPEFGEIGSPDSKKDLLSPNNSKSFRIPTTKSKKRAKDRKALDDPDRLRRKIARAKERRATIVLGVIMATFILCWLPFFATYVIATLAKLHIPDLVFAIMFWAGYCNSALNPIIYTIFNRDFRLAFERIIFGRRWGGYY